MTEGTDVHIEMLCMTEDMRVLDDLVVLGDTGALEDAEERLDNEISAVLAVLETLQEDLNTELQKNRDFRRGNCDDLCIVE